MVVSALFKNAFNKKRISQASLVGSLLMVCVCFFTNAQTAPPPTFGEETKGTPAVPEIKQDLEKKTENLDEETKETKKSFANELLGEATIKEQRRENGQVYLIELEHSSGSKQYIEENDSDGKILSDDIKLDDTPNLPKWKLGSW